MITRSAELAPPDRAGALAGHTDTDRSVSDATRRRIIDAVPANTVRAYARQWAAFTTWCAAAGRAALPATAETLAEYVAHLADAGRAPATIEQTVAAIRTAHRAAGHRDQPDTEGARLVLRGHRRQRAAAGRRARQAPPVTIEALRAMVEHCDPTTTIGLRDRVALVLGLALMGRRSELAALEISDVIETPDGLEVLISWSALARSSGLSTPVSVAVRSSASPTHRGPTARRHDRRGRPPTHRAGTRPAGIPSPSLRRDHAGGGLVSRLARPPWLRRAPCVRLYPLR